MNGCGSWRAPGSPEHSKQRQHPSAVSPQSPGSVKWRSTIAAEPKEQSGSTGRRRGSRRVATGNTIPALARKRQVLLITLPCARPALGSLNTALINPRRRCTDISTSCAAWASILARPFRVCEARPASRRALAEWPAGSCCGRLRRFDLEHPDPKRPDPKRPRPSVMSAPTLAPAPLSEPAPPLPLYRSRAPR